MVTEFIGIVIDAGRSAVELGLFVVLPIMIVMITFMRVLEGWGVLDRLVAVVAPLFKPFGLTGLGVFAMLQITFIGFAGPIATLAIMDRQGASRRHIAATLAMVLSMAQANVLFPMSAKGLDLPISLLFSVVAGLVGAASTYYIFARSLPKRTEPSEQLPEHITVDSTRNLVNIINQAGKEAFTIVYSAIPLLILALVAVNILNASGLVTYFGEILAPLFNFMNLSPNLLLPIVSKYIGGGTAMMGIVSEQLQNGLITIGEFNRVSGFLIHTFDLPGVAILISAGARVAGVIRLTIGGVVVAIMVRTLLHVLWF